MDVTSSNELASSTPALSDSLSVLLTLCMCVCTSVLVCSHTCAIALVEVKGFQKQLSVHWEFKGLHWGHQGLSGKHFHQWNHICHNTSLTHFFSFSFTVSQVQNQLHTDFIYSRNMQNRLINTWEHSFTPRVRLLSISPNSNSSVT